MIEFTLQKDLDSLGFGRRWGCYATGFINIVEHEIGRRLYESELNQIVGAWFRLGLVLLCNYKNDRTALTPGSDPAGWGPQANPEWHWYVINRRATLLTAMEVVGITDLKHVYNTVIVNVSASGGTTHYMVEVDGTEMINPDPSLTGPVVERRSIQV